MYGGGGRLDPPDTGNQPRVSHASLCFTMSKSNLHGQFSRLLDPQAKHLSTNRAVFENFIQSIFRLFLLKFSFDYTVHLNII